MVSKMGKNISVYVGLSGGVDSSVSAALLKKAGCDVTGVFIKVWQPDWIECSWREERRDAMRVAAHLGIPFVTLDLEKEYKKGVIDYMIAEYAAGRTPNPDVMCNREIKFGAFWKWAEKHGADYIATGHYARIGQKSFKSEESLKTAGSQSRSISNTDSSQSKYTLLKGCDDNKDQSYFLWTLKQNDLRHIFFPVGHLEKPAVRKLAGKFGLPTADKKDSQGLCFIGKIDVKEFLSRYIDTKLGDILNENGNIVGKHSGSALLTIGERHGFTVTQKMPNDKPYYVIGKNVDANTITVSNRIAPDEPVSNTSKLDKTGGQLLPGYRKSIKISNCNWIRRIPSAGDSFEARSRYRQPLQNIKILMSDNLQDKGLASEESQPERSGIALQQGENRRSHEKSISYNIEFEKPQDYLTPGQSLIIYAGDECIGGGVID